MKRHSCEAPEVVKEQHSRRGGVDRCHDRNAKNRANDLRAIGAINVGWRGILVSMSERDHEYEDEFPGHVDDADEPSPDGFDPPDRPAEPPEAAESETYWSLSRAPLESLVFTMPLVLAYEGGVLLLGRGSPRNGADVWLRGLLDSLGFGAYFLLPALTVVGLLAWHHVEHDRWAFRPGVLAAMALESVVLAAMLLGIARLQERVWPAMVPPQPFGVVDAGILQRLIGFCGAGLYEEVLFRLLLLPVVAWGFRIAGWSSATGGIAAILLTSLLFSAAHYVGPLGDRFELYSFTFRTVAGIFFAVLFCVRGFGITAGTHAAYDMLVGLF
jgi:hypothetical protein